MICVLSEQQSLCLFKRVISENATELSNNVFLSVCDVQYPLFAAWRASITLALQSSNALLKCATSTKCLRIHLFIFSIRKIRQPVALKTISNTYDAPRPAIIASQHQRR